MKVDDRVVHREEPDNPGTVVDVNEGLVYVNWDDIGDQGFGYPVEELEVY